MVGLPKTRPRHFENPVTLGVLVCMAAIYGAAYVVGDIGNYSGRALSLVKIHDNFLPMFMYGVMWLTVAGLCFAGLFSRRMFRIGFSSYVAACAGWSLLYAVLWINDTASFGLIVSALWWSTTTLLAHTVVVTELTAVKKIAHENGLEDNEVR